MKDLQTQQTPNELAQDPLATPPRVEHSTLKNDLLTLNLLQLCSYTGTLIILEN
jgi:hypothetical protein